jgi:hypothetical protein
MRKKAAHEVTLDVVWQELLPGADSLPESGARFHLQKAPGYPNALMGLGMVEASLGFDSIAAYHLRAYLRTLPNAPNAAAVKKIFVLEEGLGQN